MSRTRASLFELEQGVSGRSMSSGQCVRGRKDGRTRARAACHYDGGSRVLTFEGSSAQLTDSDVDELELAREFGAAFAEADLRDAAVAVDGVDSLSEDARSGDPPLPAASCLPPSRRQAPWAEPASASLSDVDVDAELEAVSASLQSAIEAEDHNAFLREVSRQQGSEGAGSSGSGSGPGEVRSEGDPHAIFDRIRDARSFSTTFDVGPMSLERVFEDIESGLGIDDPVIEVPAAQPRGLAAHELASDLAMIGGGSVRTPAAVGPPPATTPPASEPKPASAYAPEPPPASTPAPDVKAPKPPPLAEPSGDPRRSGDTGVAADAGPQPAEPVAAPSASPAASPPTPSPPARADGDTPSSSAPDASKAAAPPIPDAIEHDVPVVRAGKDLSAASAAAALLLAWRHGLNPDPTVIRAGRGGWKAYQGALGQTMPRLLDEVGLHHSEGPAPGEQALLEQLNAHGPLFVSHVGTKDALVVRSARRDAESGRLLLGVVDPGGEASARGTAFETEHAKLFESTVGQTAKWIVAHI